MFMVGAMFAGPVGAVFVLGRPLDGQVAARAGDPRSLGRVAPASSVAAWSGVAALGQVEGASPAPRSTSSVGFSL